MAYFDNFGAAGLSNATSPIVVNGKLAGNRSAEQPDSVSSFPSVFSDALQNLTELDQVKAEDSRSLAVGDMDNLALMQVNSLRADTALSLFIELRNRALDAYQEIMRINV